MSLSSRTRTRPIVAIDGPAGAGKSTVASHLARKFGFLNLETGAMYRALALKALQSGANLDDEAELAKISSKIDLQIQSQPDGNRVLLDGVDVSQRVRQPDVTAAASRVSVHPVIRAWMVDQQRLLGKEGGVVMEGRDIGTVVFPDAEVKIFLDASPETRGDRRYRQGEPGKQAETPALVLQEIRDRDARDRTRAESPLRPATDAVLLDTTNMTLPEVLTKVEAVVNGALTE